MENNPAHLGVHKSNSLEARLMSIILPCIYDFQWGMPDANLDRGIAACAVRSVLCSLHTSARVPGKCFKNSLCNLVVRWAISFPLGSSFELFFPQDSPNE